MDDGTVSFKVATVGAKDATITWNNALSIAADGNVSLGTSSTEYGLTVAGSVSAQGGLSALGITSYDTGDVKVGNDLITPHPEFGFPGLKEGDSWSQSYADERFDGDIVEFEDYVKSYVEVPLEQHQFDALVAWVYNLGPNNLKESTMLKVLNEGKYELVPSEMKRWNKAGGEVLEGLERRRLAESMLFQGNGDWHTV